MSALDDVLRAEVRAQVERRGWTLRETAERLTDAGWQVSHPMVQRLLGGSRKVTVSEWLALALALSEPPLRLLLPDGSRRYEVAGRKSAASGDRIAAWITGQTPLDTVPNPRHYRSAAGAPTHPGETEYAAMLRHMADVFDSSAPEDRPGVAFDVLRWTVGVLDHDRWTRRHPRSGEPPMAALRMSERKSKRTKRARKASTEVTE